MKLADSLSISPHVVAREVGNETVLLDLESGKYFGLEQVSLRVWQEIENGHSLEKICEKLLEEYDVSRDVLEKDILALAENLLTRKLVTLG